MGKRRGCLCCSDWWDERAETRKEFRQNHGGGPEEISHRKKGKYEKKKRTNHKHIYVERITEDNFYNLISTKHIFECAEWNCDKSYVKYEWRMK